MDTPTLRDRPMTPHEVNLMLIEAKRELDAAQTEVEQAVTAAGEAKDAYEKAVAIRYTTLRADESKRWTEPWLDKEIHADLVIADLKTVMVMAQSRETVAKRNHNRLCSVLSASQTMANMLRQEMRFAGADGRP